MKPRWQFTDDRKSFYKWVESRQHTQCGWSYRIDNQLIIIKVYSRKMQIERWIDVEIPRAMYIGWRSCIAQAIRHCRNSIRYEEKSRKQPVK